MALGRHAWSSGKRIKGREQCHEMPGPASHRKGAGNGSSQLVRCGVLVRWWPLVRN